MMTMGTMAAASTICAITIRISQAYVTSEPIIVTGIGGTIGGPIRKDRVFFYAGLTSIGD